jgi:hypothetical protein
MKLRKGDYLIYAFVIVAVIYSFKISEKFPLNYVEVVTPYKELIFPLKQDKVITVKGTLGTLTLSIKNGKVRVIKSSCLNKICIKTGWITCSGEYIACVPNHILIKLVSRKPVDKRYDFITE